ncbi:FMN-dependent NADH-azoreductase [Novosphingobium jiangmenense]|uniref:FMN dependent NADH:quinone oxidoreductase n=1 Tax=Novosphingobium jiangmenense TaxID=2791981 RepID=A0ABS0HBD7_9SPHN|nr:NAD(P)H-dependent oxidoreductase [Novosphingobium jiangmenense]MBF9149587.1 NAD(P)H-dependent oxidoreductase [Novosphingobium jiangmenense]
MKILHIDSSTSGEESVSRELTSAIVAQLAAKTPGAVVERLDLAASPLDHLDAVAGGALRLPPDAQSDAMKAAAPAELAHLRQFMSADVAVIGAPMYNFSVPSQLKAWLDRLAVPGVAFTYSEAGPKGLAGSTRVIIASSQGGMYGESDPAEHQESLLRVFFGLLGVTDLTIVRADKIGFGPEARAASIAAAKAEIAAL